MEKCFIGYYNQSKLYKKSINFEHSHHILIKCKNVWSENEQHDEFVTKCYIGSFSKVSTFLLRFYMYSDKKLKMFLVNYF